MRRRAPRAATLSAHACGARAGEAGPATWGASSPSRARRRGQDGEAPRSAAHAAKGAFARRTTGAERGGSRGCVLGGGARLRLAPHASAAPPFRRVWAQGSRMPFLLVLVVCKRSRV
eukprot:scaffold59_cov411-Prasinococcus_capsulatus_cf.AAC.1